MKGSEKASIRSRRVLARAGLKKACMLDVLRWSLMRFEFTWLCYVHVESCIGLFSVARKKLCRGS